MCVCVLVVCVYGPAYDADSGYTDYFHCGGVHMLVIMLVEVMMVLVRVMVVELAGVMLVIFVVVLWWG